MPPSRAQVRRPSRLRPELTLALVSALVTSAIVVVVLRLWAAHPNVPLGAGGDVPLNLMIIKNMEVTGWYTETPLLGAPLGQDLAPWPALVGDLWYLLVLKALTLVLSPVAALNVVYLATYPLTAAASSLAFRGLRLSRTTGLVLSIAYALLPYHFMRGESHVFLAGYAVVPLAALVAFWTYTGELRMLRSPRRFGLREGVALATAVLLMGSGLYYAVFAVMLVAAAGALRAIAERSARPLGTPLWVGGLVGVGLLVGAIPRLLHDDPVGSTPAVAGRTYGATEYFGLKLVNLLLPPTTHRVPALAGLRGATSDSLIPGEGTESIGLLGVLGLVVLVVALLTPALAHRSAAAHTARGLGALTAVVLLAATVGGLNGVLAIAGLTQLRAWNRISVLVAFLALAGLGVALDAARDRYARRLPVRVVRYGVPVAAAALVGVAVLDQTSPRLTPAYDEITTRWNADAAYFSRVESAFEPGAAIFQLPLVDFPEGGTVESMPYNDQLRGYLHSDLAWSFGGVKGQDGDWQRLALEHGVSAALPKIVAAGFDGILVNRLGFADRGAGVEEEIRRLAGPVQPIVNGDGTLVVYDLRVYAAWIADHGEMPDVAGVLSPVRAEFGAGFYDEETANGLTWRWARADATLVLHNPAGSAARVTLTGSVHVKGADPHVSVQVGDTRHELTVTDGVAQIDLDLEVEPGETDVVISTDGDATTRFAEPRDLRQQVVGLSVWTQ